MSILYIDDDTEDIEIFHEAVKAVDPSIQYLTAQNGKDALAFLNIADRLPDHIVLDFSMPAMDGGTCLQEIRKHKKFDPINVVIYSTNGFPPDIEQIRALKAKFVQKATSFEGVCNMIRSMAAEW